MKKKKKSSKKWWRVVVRSKDTRIEHDVVSKNIHSAINKVYDRKILGPDDWIERCDFLGQPTI